MVAEYIIRLAIANINIVIVGAAHTQHTHTHRYYNPILFRWKYMSGRAEKNFEEIPKIAYVFEALPIGAQKWNWSGAMYVDFWEIFLPWAGQQQRTHTDDECNRNENTMRVSFPRTNIVCAIY